MSYPCTGCGMVYCRCLTTPWSPIPVTPPPAPAPTVFNYNYTSFDIDKLMAVIDKRFRIIQELLEAIRDNQIAEKEE